MPSQVKNAAIKYTDAIKAASPAHWKVSVNSIVATGASRSGSTTYLLNRHRIMNSGTTQSFLPLGVSLSAAERRVKRHHFATTHRASSR